MGGVETTADLEFLIFHFSSFFFLCFVLSSNKTAYIVNKIFNLMLILYGTADDRLSVCLV
jgi:hypothetical protein